MTEKKIAVWLLILQLWWFLSVIIIIFVALSIISISYENITHDKVRSAEKDKKGCKLLWQIICLFWLPSGFV